MKKKTELFGSYTIHSDLYELTANINFDDEIDRFYMPCFEFLEIKDEELINQNITWDAEDWLLDMYYALDNFLNCKNYEGRQIEIMQCLQNEMNVDRKNFPLIHEMLKKGIDIGMFNEILNKE